MSAPENPPAFPSNSMLTDEGGRYLFPGMTLRDYFAGQALNGAFAELVTVSKPETKTVVARLSYEMADAMLAERAKGLAA